MKTQRSTACILALVLLVMITPKPAFALEAADQPSEKPGQSEGSEKKAKADNSVLIIGGVVVVALVVALANKGGSNSATPAAEATLPNGSFSDNPPSGEPTPQQIRASVVTSLKLDQLIRLSDTLNLGLDPFSPRDIALVAPMRIGHDESAPQFRFTASKTRISFGVTAEF